MGLDPLWLQPCRTERGEKAHQQDSAGVREGNEYTEDQGVDRLAAGADNIGRRDRLAVPGRRRMHRSGPEARKDVEKHLLLRGRRASCPDCSDTTIFTILSRHVISPRCAARLAGGLTALPPAHRR